MSNRKVDGSNTGRRIGAGPAGKHKDKQDEEERLHPISPAQARCLLFFSSFLLNDEDDDSRKMQSYETGVRHR